MLDRIGEGLIGIVHKFYDVLFSAGSQLSLSSLLCALAIAAAFLSIRHLQRRGHLKGRSLLRALFPARILRHASTKADVGYFLFNTLVYGGSFGLAGLSY